MPLAPPRRQFWRHRLSTVAAALVVTLSVASFMPSPAAAANVWTPAHAGDFPDPSVLQWAGVYYGFATQNFAPMAKTINIQVSTSSDGINWSSNTTDALPQLGAWAEQGDTWAPSVAYSTALNEFVMYYVAIEASSGDECIGEAVSSAPLGPYTDSSAAPVVCQNSPGDNLGGSIDPDIFVNPQGVASLIWKSDGNHVGVATDLWAQTLNANLLTFAANSSPMELLSDDAAWQGGIVEGPDMVNENGVDYLFYSGGDEGSSTYAIGYAVCPISLESPCTDASMNGPLMASQSGMSGPGGPSVFSPPSSQSSPGVLDMAFAAWQGTTIGYLNCGIRPMYMATLTFPGGVPTLAPAIIGAAAGNPSCNAAAPPPGYWQVAADGGIFTFGSAAFYGSTGSLRLNKPVVGMAATPNGKGYWLVASDGGIFAFGDAGFYGSTGSMHLNSPIVGMVSTIDARGYWLVASDGGVFAFGDARFYGSTGSLRLNSPIVGMVSTIDGKGYWLVASDGGVFSFGDAPFYGSLGGQHLAAPVSAMAPGYLGGGYWLVTQNGDVYPFGDARYEGEPGDAPGGYRIVGMASSRSSNGYWLASANGNVADEGDAAPYGSMIGTKLNAPIVGMGSTADGAGYWLQGADGGIFCFGDAGFLGSMGGKHLNAPMVGIASV